MKPLVCFYMDEQYIYSDKYTVYTCGEGTSVNEFLKRFESDFKKEFKIVQINFEYDNSELFKDKKPLYPANKATVFILNDYQIMSSKQLLAHLPSTITKLMPHFKPLEDKQSFATKAHKIIQAITTGRIYQANLTTALVSETKYSAEKVFKNLFEKFGGHYKALIPLEHCDLVSLSPELFLKKHNLKIRTQPIKGSIAEDGDLEKELLNNPKEEAELSMIVDLLRNDLNRLDENNPSEVTNHRSVMKLGYIQHTFSDIEITLEEDKPLSAVLEATMPGGSISGCPKIESLHVLAELEEFKRQAYTGTIGWWKENNFCLNIAIRTFVKHKNQLFYHTGCGIVYDSAPEKEWEELILKTGSINVQQ